MSKVIVVDDIKSFCDTTCQRLREMGIEAVGCYNVKKAKWLIEHAGRYDVMLVDLVLKDPGWSGTDILRWMRQQGYYQMFFLMTSYGSMQNSIETMELGAKSYIPKEIMNEKFWPRIKGIMDEQNRLEKLENQAVFRRQSKPFQQVYNDIRNYADTGIRLVITGESGTGRQHLAEDLMHISGVEGDNYAHVDCSAIAKMEHVEEYFFGHQKGAFPSAVTSTDGIMEKANESFLFMENVDRLPMEVQDMLAGVLAKKKYSRIGSTKERFVNFKVVSTSCVSLEEAVMSGKISQEFKDYLCESEVFVPPLRDTKEDIVPLAQFFIELYDPKKRKLTKEAKEKLENYAWPGNVRQLVSIIKTAIAKCHAVEIEAECLNIPVSNFRGSMSMAETEKDRIIQALKRNHGNKSKAAKELGMSRRWLYNKISEYKLPTEDN